MCKLILSLIQPSDICRSVCRLAAILIPPKSKRGPNCKWNRLLSRDFQIVITLTTIMASKKKTIEEVEEDNRHLNRQLFQLKDEMQHLNEEVKTISCQKSATLIELQQLQKEVNNLAAQLEESKAKEQYALQQSEDAEKRLEKASSQFKEKVQLMEQDCSRFQIEMSKLQLKVEKQESVILEKQEEIRVKDEAILQLEQSQSRIKVDCSTRASNIETALVRSKKKCSALAREVESMSAEKMDLLNGYEQLKSDYEMTNTPKALSVKDQVRNSMHACRRSTVSDTCLVATTSTPNGTPVHGQLNMDWDISTVMSDYHRLQQDHQCLLVNFQQTTSKLQQLKQEVKEKDGELASLQKLYDESDTKAKLLEEKLLAKGNEQGIETVVANPETIREALEAKARIHGLEQSLEDLNKQYHIRNSELLEKQTVSDNLNKQLEARNDDISSLEKKLSASLEQIQSLTKALEGRESDKNKESIREVAELRRQLDEMRRDKYALEDLLESAEGDFDQLKVRKYMHMCAFGYMYVYVHRYICTCMHIYVSMYVNNITYIECTYTETTLTRLIYSVYVYVHALCEDEIIFHVCMYLVLVIGGIYCFKGRTPEII